MPVTIEKVGRRSYLLGDTYPVKNQIKAAGGHWDPEYGQSGAWWIADAAKAAKLAEDNQAPRPVDTEAMLRRDRNNILGRAKYKDKTYYLVGEGTGQRGAWARLLFRDGSKTFFADQSQVSVEKRYQRPQTLDGLHAFADSMRENGGQMCAECGERPGTEMCYDSSGLGGMCCRRCASGPSYERSFA